jgi:regulator of RNase E activity RraA
MFFRQGTAFENPRGGSAMTEAAGVVSLEMMRQSLCAAAVCDALDSLGFCRQSPRISLLPMTTPHLLVGRCKTTLWADMAHADAAPYEKELAAVDACQGDDVIIAAAGGSTRSAIWGELLSTATRNRGCAGAIIDGAVRDIVKMRAMQFPVFARSASPYDSKDRQRVIDFDVVVEIDGVAFHPGDLVFADADGVVVVPRAVEEETIRRAWQKLHDENRTRAAIAEGMPATEAYRRYGIL